MTFFRILRSVIIPSLFFLLPNLSSSAQQKYHSAEVFGVTGNVKSITRIVYINNEAMEEERFYFNIYGEFTEMGTTDYTKTEEEFSLSGIYSEKYDSDNYLIEFTAMSDDYLDIYQIEYKNFGKFKKPIKDVVIPSSTDYFRETIYDYNNSGELTGCIINKRNINDKNEILDQSKVTYDIILRDKHQNWTLRKVTIKTSEWEETYHEKMEIEYYENKTMPSKPATEPFTSNISTHSAPAPQNTVAAGSSDPGSVILTLPQVLSSVSGCSKIGKSIKTVADALTKEGIKIEMAQNSEINFSFCNADSKIPEIKKNIRKFQIKGLPKEYSQVNVSYSEPGKHIMRCLYIFWFDNSSPEKQKNQAKTLLDEIIKMSKGNFIDFRFNESSQKYIAASSSYGTITLWITQFSSSTGVALMVDQNKWYKD